MAGENLKRLAMLCYETSSDVLQIAIGKLLHKHRGTSPCHPRLRSFLRGPFATPFAPRCAPYAVPIPANIHEYRLRRPQHLRGFSRDEAAAKTSMHVRRRLVWAFVRACER